MPIKLPNKASWDTKKNAFAQTKAARTYMETVLSSAPKRVYQKERIATNPVRKYRIKKTFYDDKANGLRVIEERVYMYPKNHRKCGAVKEFKLTVRRIPKRRTKK